MTPLRHTWPVFLLLIFACAQPHPVVRDLGESTPLRLAGESMSGYHGGTHPGRSVWLSSNGRLAVIYQWRDDTDRDGVIRIEAGYHGDMLADVPAPFLVDMHTGATTRYVELMTMAGGRYVTARDEHGVWLVDAEDGSRTKLQENEEMSRDDENACFDPRSLIIDPDGPRIGLIVEEPSHLQIRDLDEGDEWRADAGEDVVWRARFTGEEDVVVLYVIPGDSAAELPRQRTSCSDRLGMMFAASMSGGGYDGPPYHHLVVHRDGRKLRLDDDPVVVSDDVLALGDSVLMLLDGTRMELPVDCERLMPVSRSGVVLLDCNATTRVMHVERERIIPLPVQVGSVNGMSTAQDGKGDTWLSVLVHDSTSDLKRIGRLRLGDGRIEVGPMASPNARVRDGWFVTRGTGAIHLLEIATGRMHTVPSASESVGFPAVSLRPGWLLLDAAHGRYLEVERIGATNSNGCYVGAAGTYPVDMIIPGNVELGPWQVRCAGDEAF